MVTYLNQIRSMSVYIWRIGTITHMFLWCQMMNYIRYVMYIFYNCWYTVFFKAGNFADAVLFYFNLLVIIIVLQHVFSTVNQVLFCRIITPFGQLLNPIQHDHIPVNPPISGGVFHNINEKMGNVRFFRGFWLKKRNFYIENYLLLKNLPYETVSDGENLPHPVFQRITGM